MRLLNAPANTQRGAALQMKNPPNRYSRETGSKDSKKTKKLNIFLAAINKAKGVYWIENIEKANRKTVGSSKTKWKRGV